MRNGIIALMIIACLGLGAVTVFLQVTEDRQPPEIHFQENEVTYQEGDDYADLLYGVTATDSRDGDVTDSLVVESVYPNDDGKSATIVYVARDANNNIGKANKIIRYQMKNSQDEEDGPSDAELVNGSPDEPNPTEEAQPTAATTEEPTTAPTREPSTPTPTSPEDEEEEEIANLPEGSPVIRLTDKRVVISRGDQVNRISFVESITDDKDSRESLYRSIQIAGEFDRYTVGEYEQIYYVIDSDGNRSNEAKLTIVVE